MVKVHDYDIHLSFLFWNKGYPLLTMNSDDVTNKYVLVSSCSCIIVNPDYSI
jgi:hypothetical protein